ncbi:MAG: polysaccharide deacetylase family protein [Deltaproteobacteria bacterium]|nr:polysaccharide deacetylase family protein [Deltaproteobacteria bacterium]
MRALALTLDLDGPAEYAAIHGVDAGPEPLLMYGRPLARFEELCRTAGAPGTLFVVARDLHGAAVPTLAALVARGFEVGNHSHDHDYALSRHDPDAITANLRLAQERFAAALDVRPTGFRAPGYLLSRSLLDAVEKLGFAYDSSLLPSYAYMAAKSAVLGAYRVTGRRSAAIMGPPSLAFGPTVPYRPGTEPQQRGRRPFVELPLPVATPLRLPVIGTSLLLAPAWLRLQLVAALRTQDLVVLDIHAMDLVDAHADDLPEPLARRQPELKIPLDKRLDDLDGIVGALAEGRELLTGAEIATRLATSL